MATHIYDIFYRKSKDLSKENKGEKGTTDSGDEYDSGIV